MLIGKSVAAGVIEPYVIPHINQPECYGISIVQHESQK